MIKHDGTGRLVNEQVRLPADPPDIYITRDSDIDGTPGEVCDLWIEKPKWCSNEDTDTPDARGGCWINPDEHAYEQCYVGPHTLNAVRAQGWPLPDDDRMCIKIDGTRTKGPASDV